MTPQERAEKAARKMWASDQASPWVGMSLTSVGPGQAVMTLSWLFLMPVTFASNIFVDPATMPGWLQTVVSLNPVAHLVTVLRAVLEGNATLPVIAIALIAPAILLAIFGPVTMLLYRRQR